jgi:hypothetical protein
MSYELGRKINFTVECILCCVVAISFLVLIANLSICNQYYIVVTADIAQSATTLLAGQSRIRGWGSIPGKVKNLFFVSQNPGGGAFL